VGGSKLVLFYPNVSITAHGNYLPQDIPHYELVFTTKTFGIKDLEQTFGVKNAIFIPHGFDPNIHRKLEITPEDKKAFGCDASFIGTFSPKKERLLAALKNAIPGIDLKIWGNQWFKSTSPVIKDCIQHTAISGDMYAMAIQCSKINLGILSEKVSGASSGDLITSRTFHIPGSAGFLLHEKNEESVQYFKQDIEAGFFDVEEDLVAQVKKYLANDSLRETVRIAGYERAQKEHSLDARAATVIDHINLMQ
jgi:spore maturation protein CgeB